MRTAKQYEIEILLNMAERKNPIQKDFATEIAVFTWSLLKEDLETSGLAGGKLNGQQVVEYFKERREMFVEVCARLKAVNENKLTADTFDEMMKVMIPSNYDWYKANVIDQIPA